MKQRTFYLIRHGRSEGNEDHNVYVTKKDCDIDLTQEGVEQAKAVGENFKSWKDSQWDDSIIYVSPYLRTMETMRHALGPFFKCPVLVDYRIREQCFGVPDTLEDVAKNWKNYDSNPYYYQNKGSESHLAVFDRIHSWLDGVASRQRNESNIIVFTHGHVINVIATILETTPMHEHPRKGYLRNGAIKRVEVRL